ncbi:MAG: type II toxin-antitoxin system VapC family toxin [Candidatus Methanofastidiosia archaeon]
MASSKNSEIPVILDTNFLISAVGFGISLDFIHDTILCNYRIVVPANVRMELLSLNLKGKEDKMRRVAIQLSEQFDTLELYGHVDDSLVDYASSHKAVVATNDSALKKRLRAIGTPVMFIKKRCYFAIEGEYQNI